MAKLIVEGFPDDLFKAVKIEAVNRGTNMKAVVIDILKRYFAKGGGK
jgi:plasmid stability protein